MDAYALLKIYLGLRFQMFGEIEELVLQADATNVTDEKYLSTIDSNGFVTSDSNDTAQTLLLGAPAQLFLSVRARF